MAAFLLCADLRGNKPWKKTNKKPGARAGLFVVAPKARDATAYPAGCRTSGRRARDVMPAAMRALVSTVAV